MNNIVTETFRKVLSDNKMEQASLPGFSPLEEFLKTPPPLPEIIIDSILRRGWKAQIASSSGAGKSFLLLQLGIAIANGGDWLKFKCQKGRVLYVNLEIDEASFIERINGILKAKNIKLDTSHFDLWNLRGYSRHSSEIIEQLIHKSSLVDYSAIIIDPIYKLLSGNENSNFEIKNFLGFLDEISENGPAVIIVHHFSKGSAGGKNAIDRNSGAGVFARDPDTMITLTGLEKIENGFRIETAKSRNFAPIQPFTVRFEFPIHIVDESLQAHPMEGECRRKAKTISPEEAVKIFSNGYLTKKEALEKLEIAGCSARSANTILATFCHDGVLEEFYKSGGSKFIGRPDDIKKLKKT